ncbi:PH domain-containing protein [Streptomyces nondiastaticus]|uniref:PH domain-containing protein n=1 Tax=Streptomyces nondiastaticus TaxID=3154512 RepID=UPI00343D07FE
MSDMDEYRVTGVAWRILAACWGLCGLAALCWVTFSIGWGAYLDAFPDDDGDSYVMLATAILTLPLPLGALVHGHRARTWVADDGLRTRRLGRVRFLPWQEIAKIDIGWHRYGNDGPYHNLYIQVRLRNGRRRKLPALSTEPRMYAVHTDMVARWKAATGAATAAATGAANDTDAGAPHGTQPRMVQLTK